MKPKKIISLKKLTGKLKEAFNSLYGDNFGNYITEFVDPRDNNVCKAVALETDDAHYLVVVDKKYSKVIFEDEIDLEDDNLQDDYVEN